MYSILFSLLVTEVGIVFVVVVTLMCYCFTLAL